MSGVLSLVITYPTLLTAVCVGSFFTLIFDPHMIRKEFMMHLMMSGAVGGGAASALNQLTPSGYEPYVAAAIVAGTAINRYKNRGDYY